MLGQKNIANEKNDSELFLVSYNECAEQINMLDLVELKLIYQKIEAKEINEWSEWQVWKNLDQTFNKTCVLFEDSGEENKNSYKIKMTGLKVSYNKAKNSIEEYFKDKDSLKQLNKIKNELADEKGADVDAIRGKVANISSK